jgi:hypothetical protein
MVVSDEAVAVTNLKRGKTYLLTPGLKTAMARQDRQSRLFPNTVESVPISSNWERLNFPQVTEEH